MDEAAAWRPSLRPEEETEAEVVAEEADASDTRLWPSAVRRLGQGAALVLIALFALYVAAQVTTTLANLAHLPGWLDLMILPVVVLPLVIVGWFTWKLVHLFLSLKPNRPIRLAALEQLRERTKLRAAAEKKTREAQERLLAYLKAFPLDKKHERRWAALECRPEEIAGLRAVRDRLMAAGLRPTAEQWIQDFVDQFLKPLNEVAKRRVWFYGRRVGVATASAPIPLMDTLIVLSHSLAMIVDLCWIYNLRTGGGATLVVLVRSVAHSYLAGQMQDLTEAGHEAIGGHIQDMIGQMGSKLVGFFSKRIAEGTANGVLLWHLGRSAIRLLKPVQ